MSIDVMKAALEALERCDTSAAGLDDFTTLQAQQAITALRTAIEQTEFDATHEALEREAGIHISQQQAERQEPPPEYQTEAEKRAYKFGFRKALHSKPADCLREMYELLQRCENEMRYAGWDKLEADNFAKNGVYEEVKELLEKNNG